MKKLLPLLFVVIFCAINLCSCSSKQDVITQQTTQIVAKNKAYEKDEYRRSSLCLILLTHKDKEYAKQMEEVFKKFPLPAKYNEHNIESIRVISVKGKQNKNDIDKLLINNNVAQSIVGRWFNRNPYTGKMDMNLIYDRGGYGATYEDYLKAQNTVRGTAALQDKGLELLQSTFVLVCDMDYIDKKKGAQWGAFGLALLSGLAQGMSSYSAYQGDYSSARAWQSASNLGRTGAAVVADIGGFRVKMTAYLYKLAWDNNTTNTFFNTYWIDDDTPILKRERIKNMFKHSNLFKLDYVGKYKASSSKTILRSWNDEKEVILDVCKRCVDKGITSLSKKYPDFRPRAPFYLDGNAIYSHIGTKEDVKYEKKYEIIQPYKDKNGRICYKRVGKAECIIAWRNKNIRYDQYFNDTHKGSKFRRINNNVDLRSPGLMLREL